MHSAVFLDRDNTLIINEGDLGQPDEVRLVEGVAVGLRRLREAGFHLIVVTNQGGVARGRFTEDDVDAVHQRIAGLVDADAQRVGLIDRFYYCPYHPQGTVPEYRREHIWRKPHPGMLIQAAHDMSIDLSNSWMIGDQERDIQAGRAAGCRTVLVTTDADLAQRAGSTVVAGDFAEAVRLVLENSNLPIERQQPSLNGRSLPAMNASATGIAAPDKNQESASIRRAITELIEELRSDRLRRADFTLIRMIAGGSQLLALALAALGFMQLGNSEVFIKWMVGAMMVQLFTVTILLVDLKG